MKPKPCGESAACSGDSKSSGSHHTNPKLCALHPVGLCQPLQNLMDSQAAIRHGSMLDATSAKVTQPASLWVLPPANKQQTNAPCRRRWKRRGGNTVAPLQGSTSPPCTRPPNSFIQCCSTAAPLLGYRTTACGEHVAESFALLRR